MLDNKLILKDAIMLLEAVGYTFEGFDSGVRLYYHPRNPRQHILTIPCRYDLNDELSEEISKRIYEAINRYSSIKH